MGNLCAKDDTDQTATSPLSGQKKGGTPAPGKATTGRATKFSYQLIPPTQPKYEASRDPADYACEKLPPGTPWVRLPGQINDQRINIETARGSVFVLLDQCDSVQIDDAQDCSFYIGPTTGAVFIRDCKNCKFVVLCGQLRLRDTHNSSFALYCRSRPVIESSTKVSIGCFSAPQYIELRSQMAKAGLSIWNNLWYHVHDFTPKSGNWSPLSPEAARDVLPTIAAFSKGEVSEEEERISRVVPYVCGPSNVDPRLATTTFVSKPGATDEVENFFLAEVSEGSRWKLVETGEVKLSDDNCAALTAMSGVSVFCANHVVVVIVAVVPAESAATLKDLAWVAHYEQGARGQQLRDCLIGGAGADSGFGQAL